MGNDTLKHYLMQYGEVNLLNDLAVVFQELGTDWLASGNKRLGYILTDAATTLANVGHQLEVAELAFVSEQGLDNSADNQRKRYQLELDSLMIELEVLSSNALGQLHFTEVQELIVKSKRMEWLKKQLTSSDKPIT